MTPQFKTLIAVLGLVVSIMIAACVSSDGTVDSKREAFRLALGVATIAMIEQSDDITRQGVLDTIHDIRSTVKLDGTVTAAEILGVTKMVIDKSGVNLKQEDQNLLNAVFLLADSRLSLQADLSKVSATADEILMWVESAALLASPSS